MYFLFLSHWLIGFYRIPKCCGYPPQHDGNILFLKTSHAFSIEDGEIWLGLHRKLSFSASIHSARRYSTCCQRRKAIIHLTLWTLWAIIITSLQDIHTGTIVTHVRGVIITFQLDLRPPLRDETLMLLIDQEPETIDRLGAQGNTYYYYSTRWT